MSAPDRTHVGNGSGDYETPPPLGKLITTRYALNYDAFASHENALLPTYSTIDGTFVKRHRWRDERPPAKLGDATGLDYDWTGLRVFCNAPYGRGILRRCIEKMVAEIDRAEIIVALLPVSTSAGWFRELVEPNAFIEWLPYRVAFVHPPFKCSETCEHALGEPLTSPPGDNIVAEFRQPNGYAMVTPVRRLHRGGGA